MNPSPLTILKKYWKHDAFRPLQEEIIHSVLEGKDVLALLPTGGGKSICFQVPAMAKKGICLVISPLIALMKDQVQHLRRKNITAFAIYSGMSRKEVITTLKVAVSGNCKFLYVSPERLETDLFKEYLPALDVNLLAVDEAHCISQWGYDFRPPYLRIATLRAELPGVPVLALTASATVGIQQDICAKLQLHEPIIYRQSFLRENLSFSVFRAESIFNKISDIIRKVPGTAIIYCRNRRRSKEISDLLNMQGIPADYYHAGLKSAERALKQDNWMNNKCRVIVCTNAFGMGIDKPDVRLVIHADIPDCVENYYQEAGRAGRDGKKSYAVLLYTDQMMNELSMLFKTQYPSLDYIRNTYQAVSNYLQVPLGTENTYYDFDLADFQKKFRLDAKPSIAALKMLDQENILSFNEQVFVPSTVLFISGKEWLYGFEKENPLLEPLIKTLLRSYSGIFDQPVRIHEKVIAGLLRRDVEDIIRDLQELHRYRVIDYEPQKENPQVLFIKPRMKASELQINRGNYEKRKQQFIKRVEAMLALVNTNDCRSAYISRYFGETDPANCGVCDNCLKVKNKGLTKQKFDLIYKEVVEATHSQSIEAGSLMNHFQHIQREQLKQVIDYLQSENRLQIDHKGMVHISP